MHNNGSKKHQMGNRIEMTHNTQFYVETLNGKTMGSEIFHYTREYTRENRLQHSPLGVHQPHKDLGIYYLTIMAPLTHAPSISHCSYSVLYSMLCADNSYTLFSLGVYTHTHTYTILGLFTNIALKHTLTLFPTIVLSQFRPIRLLSKWMSLSLFGHNRIEQWV